MSFSEVFGGAVIYPAGQTYLALTFSTDQTLAWPIEQAIAGDNVASSIMDLNPTQPGLNVDFDDARQVSQGIQTVFNNVSGGGDTVTIRDATGGVITTIVDGTAWVVYLTDNSTEAGTWRIFQLGAGSTVAVAGALAGAGLKAITTTLNQTIAPTSTAATPITWTDGDRAQLTIWTGAVGILDLPNPVTVGSDWFSMVRNGGSGSLTITPPSGTIDDGATLVLDPGQSATVVTDGTNFFTIGLGQSTAGFFDFLELNVAGSGDFTLSGVQLNRISYRFIGVLTGNRKIIVPGTVQQYWVDNSTTGAFLLEVATAAQITPVQIGQNQRNITYCDGTDVLAAESSSFTSPLAISQGGTGATTAPNAISNLGAAADTIDLIAGDGITGGGDLSGPDRTFNFDLASISIAVPDQATDFFVFQDVDNADVNAKALLSSIGITIEEEGAPLATPANSLNFVGGFVTASGAMAAKTINIGAPYPLADGEEIQWGTGNDIQMSFDCGVALVLSSTMAGGQAIVQDSPATNANLEIDQRNLFGGMRYSVRSGTGDGQIANTNNAGVLQNVLVDFLFADDSVHLYFSGSVTANTAITSGAYPHNAGGGFEVNNSATGNGDSRSLTWYDQHSACGVTNISRNLVGATPVVDPDLTSDDDGGPTLRQGRYALDMFMVIQGQDASTDFVFDFAGTNLSLIAYSWEAESADGTPFSRGASGTVSTDQTVDLGATVGEEVFLRIRGHFFINANGGIIQFRWAPTANVIDDVTRQQNCYMKIAATRIG